MSLFTPLGTLESLSRFSFVVDELSHHDIVRFVRIRFSLVTLPTGPAGARDRVVTQGELRFGVVPLTVSMNTSVDGIRVQRMFPVLSFWWEGRGGILVFP